MAYCSYCGTQISDAAQACPHCGHPQQAVTGRVAGWQGMATYPGQNLGLPPTGPNSLADAGQRLGARLLDVVIVVVGFLVVFLVFLAIAGAAQAGLNETNPISAFFMVLAICVPIAGAMLYEVGLTALRGQTLGKSAIGIKVVRSADGQVPGWGPSFLRWIIPILMGIVPLGGILDALWLLWDENRQCLHDKVANTLVVRVR